MKLLVNGWWHDLKTMICLRGNKWHIYFGCIFVLYFLFAGFSNVVKLMISVCLYCFLGSKLCCLSTYANCFSVNYHRKNSCPDQIKKGFLFVCFLFNWKWEMMPTFLFRFFVFVSIFLIILEVVNWFLLDWRLQDYYGNFGKVSSRQRTAVLSQIVFWMNNLMMKFKSFCLLDAYCGRGSTHSVTTPI